MKQVLTATMVSRPNNIDKQKTTTTAIKDSNHTSQAVSHCRNCSRCNGYMRANDFGDCASCGCAGHYHF
ncbi:MAG: hypothetical protein R2800_08240 [Flavipsychrobacter sp.]